jgi:hypothetical protein
MTSRYVSGIVAAVLLTCGVIAFAPAPVSAQGTTLLPEKGGPITLVGCFLRMPVADEGNKFVLVNPTLGAATSVEEATCRSTGNEQMVELDDVHTNVHKHHLDRAKVGRWIEVTGRLEKAGHQALREVHVNSYRIVPVVPRVAEAAPVFEPPIAPSAIPQETPVEQPVATTGVAEPELPKTASPVPLIAVFGFLALAAGLALRIRGYRRTL